MLRKSFRFKIIIPTVTVMLILVLMLNIFLAVRFSVLSSSLVNERLSSIINSLNLYIEEKELNSKIASVSMAADNEAIKAIKERDTEEILRIFANTDGLYRINYCTVTDSSGVVLVRIHEPDNFGDSIANQQNVKDALEGKVSTYFEEGTAVRVSVRTGSPVYDRDGTLIGVVSAGVRFETDAAINELKELFNAEVSVYIDGTVIASTINPENYGIHRIIDPNIAEVVIGNKLEFSGKTEIFGERYQIFYKPLLDAQNEVFAVLSLGISEAYIMQSAKRSVIDGIILGLGGLTVIVVLLFYIISTISKPISKLSSHMNNIANGNLSIDINIKTDDEVGKLGMSLQKVLNILQKLLEDIKIMIGEQEKGNTEYCLDTQSFLGDYRVLADSVLELAAFSMNDQLTGLPNRRSFDNRLEWEWNRSGREKKPLGILLMDLDRFKNYNDTFGHQQGDIALKTTADTIKKSLKRSVDFAARWGGEEFVVLLPDTDSAGAVRVAEKLRKAIEKMTIPCPDPSGEKITISIGIGVYTNKPVPDSQIERLISAADTALYKAKDTGRNRIMLGE